MGRNRLTPSVSDYNAVHTNRFVVTGETTAGILRRPQRLQLQQVEGHADGTFRTPVVLGV